MLPALGAVRIAVHAGDDADGITFLYEIPHDVVAPAYIPGILRTTLAGTQLYSSDDIGDVMGMTLIRLHPERITPAPSPNRTGPSASCAPCRTPATTRTPF